MREGRSIRLTGEGETLMHHVDAASANCNLVSAASRRAGLVVASALCAELRRAVAVPRLRKLLVETDRLEVRIAADTGYTRFVDDEFDADIVYGASPSYLRHIGTTG